MTRAGYARIFGGLPRADGAPRHDAEINVSQCWRQLQRPVLSDATEQVWVLGASARERADALESLQAPDFTLPDLDGNTHALSDYRGNKIFLASWASW